MYAVIRTGGKQEKVSEGQRVRVERLPGAEGDEVSFTPLLLVDDDRVVASPADLSRASVSARVVGQERGPKIRGFTYRSKTRTRRRWGHRQNYTTIEITGIKRESSAEGASGFAGAPEHDQLAEKLRFEGEQVSGG